MSDRGASEVIQKIEEDSALSRRAFVGGAAAAAVATTLLSSSDAEAAKEEKSLAAVPPAGFTPMSSPGTIVKVSKAGCLQTNELYPKEDDAKAMLTLAMTKFTNKSDLPEAIKLFFHPQDIVCVKLNGIALTNMGTNKELVLPFLEAMIAAGVPAENITVLEQYGSFLGGTRVNAQNVPKGVKVTVHGNGDTTMPERAIRGTGATPKDDLKTKFCRTLTESTAVVNFSLIKDHSICGYTGLLKNMTHGTQTSPHIFHSHHANPQIAQLYAQDIIKSRVRLNITDGFKIMAHGGPLWKSAKHVKKHESVYVSTDAVAMDTIGAELVDKLRAEFNLKSLADEGRAPAYIKAAADMGLGIGDKSQIQLKEFTI